MTDHENTGTRFATTSIMYTAAGRVFWAVSGRGRLTG